MWAHTGEEQPVRPFNMIRNRKTVSGTAKMTVLTVVSSDFEVFSLMILAYFYLSLRQFCCCENPVEVLFRPLFVGPEPHVLKILT